MTQEPKATALYTEPWKTGIETYRAIHNPRTSSEEEFIERIGKPDILNLNISQASYLTQSDLDKINSFLLLIENKLKETPVDISEPDQITLNNLVLFLNKRFAASEPIGELKEKAARLARTLIREESKDENIQYIEFADLFPPGKYTAELLDLIGRNLSAVQLTSGCSVQCPRCNSRAPKKVRRYLSLDCIKRIVKLWGPYLKKNYAYFYYNSDPFDWKQVDPKTGKTWTYNDVQEYVKEHAGYTPYVSTAVPVDSEEHVNELAASGNTIRLSSSNINAASLSKRNFWAGQTLRELQDSVNQKGSRIFVSGSYKDNKRHQNKDQNSPADETLPHPVGINYDMESARASIACRNGTLITPDGVYSNRATATTPYSFKGKILHPIHPSTSEVLKYRHNASADINNFLAYENDHISNGEASAELPLSDYQIYAGLYQALLGSLLTSKIIIPEVRNEYFYSDSFPVSQYLTNRFSTEKQYPAYNIEASEIDRTEDEIFSLLKNGRKVWNELCEKRLAGSRIEVTQFQFEDNFIVEGDIYQTIMNYCDRCGDILELLNAATENPHNDFEGEKLKLLKDFSTDGLDIDAEAFKSTIDDLGKMVLAFQQLNQKKLWDYGQKNLAKFIKAAREYLAAHSYAPVFDILRTTIKSTKVAISSNAKDENTSNKSIWTMLRRALGVQLGLAFQKLESDSLNTKLNNLANLVIQILILNPENSIIDKLCSGAEISLEEAIEAGKMLWQKIDIID